MRKRRYWGRIVALVTIVLLVPVGALLISSGVPYTAASHAATPAGATLPLYDNGVAPGFSDGSFGVSSRDSCDAVVYYSPPCSFAATYQAWGAVSFLVTAGTLDTSGFTTLLYDIDPAGQPFSDFGVLFVDSTGASIRQVALSSANVSALSGGWFQVSLPLSRLNPRHLPVGAIQLKNETSADLRTVHYDDIELAGGSGTPNPFFTSVPLPSPTPLPPAPYHRPPLLPGQRVWAGGVSSFLFGSNDSEEWSPDNVESDPHGIIQSSMRAAHFTLERTFIFHYSIRDGHRTTIGTHPRAWLYPHHPHQYDLPQPPTDLFTGKGYEVETRIRTVERMGAHCLVTFPDIWTTPKHNTDPNPFHHRVLDPNTGRPETDLDFARKVVAYLGTRCNLYEIGNEPDLDTYTENGLRVPHMDVKTYVERWTEFVRALRAINPKAKFIGPVTYNSQGNDCTYSAGSPFPQSESGDCYLQNFLHGVKGTDVEPDAVSFHWYPCTGATPGNCTATQWDSYATVIAEVRTEVLKDLGHTLPIGITEWNFDPGSNTTMGADSSFMADYTRVALAAMISAHLEFAAQFDTASFGGYGALDMFDVGKGDQPKAQYEAVKEIIARYRPAAVKGK